MSNCNIRIELKDDQLLYERSGMIRGQVLVEVNKRVKCDALKISLRLFTHGRGNREHHTVHSESIYHGEWEPGNHAYEFCIAIEPSVTPTFHGHYINIDWQLVATADIPWAIDPTADKKIIINRTSDENKPHVFADKVSESVQSKKLKRSGFNGRILQVFLVCAFMWYFYQHQKENIYIILLMGVIFLISIFKKIAQDFLPRSLFSVRKNTEPGLKMGSGDTFLKKPLSIAAILLILCVGYYVYARLGIRLFVFFMMFAVVFSFGFLKKSFNEVRNLLATGSIGNVDCWLGDSKFLPNEKTPFTLKFIPKRPVLVNHIEFIVIAKEVAVSGSGTNRISHQHTLVYESQRILEAESFKPGKEFFKALDIQMPTYAPATFEGKSNTIIWSIKVLVDIDNFPDWVQERPIEMI